MNRRTFLRLAGLVGVGATLSGCQPMVGQLLQASRSHAAWPTVDPAVFQVLRRLTFGPTADTLNEALRLGPGGWVEEQLAPETIDDLTAALRVRPIDELRMDAGLLADLGDRLFDGVDSSGVTTALRRGTLLRQTYSRRQLYEHMVAFWTDHFNVSTTKGDCWFLKVVDDREVIRPHAMGSFRDLLLGSIRSPAMLVYLDNQANHRNEPNENLAREVLELHTLGIDGGYQQADVEALARSLTGWTVHSRFRRGAVRFDGGSHDNGDKHVLGSVVSAAGQSEIEQIVDRLASHPSTARRVATKLVRRFLCDDPTCDAPDIVDRATKTFQRTDGDIRSTLGVVLLDGLVHDQSAPGAKLKRPNELVVSALRGLGAETDGGEALHDHIAQMGQPLFAWPTPDGPPDQADTWRSAMLPRWQFAVALAGDSVSGTSVSLRDLAPAGTSGDTEAAVDAIASRLLGDTLAADERTAIMREVRSNDLGDSIDELTLATASIMASPRFQWR